MSKQSIKYSDGSTEKQVFELLKESNDLSSETNIAQEHYATWGVRYHLTAERGTILRPFNLEGLDVLELGAGMGAVSRHIAENAKSLYVVEGTETRFNNLKERLRDLKNWDGQFGNFSDIKLDKKFDVVCLLGVLEYSELYVHPTDDQSAHAMTLEIAKKYLKPDGVVIVAIENKLGIKYWTGATEDHTGRIFDGISGYTSQKSVRTFSNQELTRLLTASGFSSVDKYYPFPDYKLASSVISQRMIDEYPRLSGNLASARRFEAYGVPRTHFLPDLLVCNNIAGARLLSEFSNSFLFLATQAENSSTLKKLTSNSHRDELAWHYSFNRQYPVKTVFKKEGNQLSTKKYLVSDAEAQERTFNHKQDSFKWENPGQELIQAGEPVRLQLVRHLYHQEWKLYFDRLKDFIVFGMKKFQAGPDELTGRALDALYINAASGKTRYTFFDLEWSKNKNISKNWYIFRNVAISFLGTDDFQFFNSNAPWKCVKDVYFQLCSELGVEPKFEQALSDEVAFQSAANGDMNVELIESEINKIFSIEFVPDRLPREPDREARLRARAYEEHHRTLQLKNEIAHLREVIDGQHKQLVHQASILQSFPHKVADYLKNKLRFSKRSTLEYRG